MIQDFFLPCDIGVKIDPFLDEPSHAFEKGAYKVSLSNFSISDRQNGLS